jgi:hypothetical protein
MKQKMVLTVLQILYFCILFQLHLGLDQLIPGCNWNSTQKCCNFKIVYNFLFTFLGWCQKDVDPHKAPLPTPFNLSEKDLGKKPFTIFSNLTSNIHVSLEKFQNKKLYSQFQKNIAFVYYLSYIRGLVNSDLDVTETAKKTAVSPKLWLQSFVLEFFRTHMNV